MSERPKRRSVALGVTIALVVVLWLMCQMHMCDLHSLWIEVPMLLCFVALVSLWAGKGVDRAQVLSRCLGVVALIFLVEFGYLLWLHSPWFPRWLLLPRPAIHRRVLNHSCPSAERVGAKGHDSRENTKFETRSPKEVRSSKGEGTPVLVA